ncbi:hypothetical protein RCL_jg13989.t1 [Rhizophagus clarus]|uniref:Uncharacterized protein n=1 Tax=Rhizophagus clarus TaxID=94130 RepID=A0A8H3LSN4_9GLOM|nr:hypothetical protein RCL_jg13989.t1 [Rhizophagus clarus]
MPKTFSVDHRILVKKASRVPRATASIAATPRIQQPYIIQQEDLSLKRHIKEGNELKRKIIDLIEEQNEELKSQIRRYQN